MRCLPLLIVCYCTLTPAIAQDDAPAVTEASPPLDVIELNNGDRISGHLVETNDEGTTIDSPVFGRVLIPHGQIKSVTTSAPVLDADATQRAKAADEAAQTAKEQGADTTAKATVIPPEEPEKVRPGLFGTGFLEGWKKSFAAGVNGSTGNTEEFNINLGLTANFEDDKDRWLFDAKYYASKSDGSTTKNQGYVRLQKDWLVPEEKYFYFAEARFDWDEFQSWDQRFNAAAGVGYQFIRNDDFDLRGRLGLGVSKEWGSEDDDWTPEALWGVRAAWQLAPKHGLTFETTGYPALDDSGKYRQLSTLDWVITIDADAGLDLKLGLEHEYQAVVDDDRKHNDLLYYAALVFNF